MPQPFPPLPSTTVTPKCQSQHSNFDGNLPSSYLTPSLPKSHSSMSPGLSLLPLPTLHFLTFLFSLAPSAALGHSLSHLSSVIGLLTQIHSSQVWSVSTPEPLTMTRRRTTWGTGVPLNLNELLLTAQPCHASTQPRHPLCHSLGP